MIANVKINAKTLFKMLRIPGEKLISLFIVGYS